MRLPPHACGTCASLSFMLLLLIPHVSARAELPRVRPESVLREDVSSAQVDPNSNAVLAWLEGAGGFGLGRLQIDFSLELMDADANTPILPFTPAAGYFFDECDLDSVPIPPGGALEGQTGYECVTGGDCHLLVHDRSRALVFEMFAANLTVESFTGICLVVWALGARDLQVIGVGDFELLDLGASVERGSGCIREDPLPDICGDLDKTDRIDVSDVTRYRLNLADPLGSPLTAPEASRCSVIGSGSDWDIADVVVLRRLLERHAPGINPVCPAGQAGAFQGAPRRLRMRASLRRS